MCTLCVEGCGLLDVPTSIVFTVDVFQVFRRANVEMYDFLFIAVIQFGLELSYTVSQHKVLTALAVLCPDPHLLDNFSYLLLTSQFR